MKNIKIISLIILTQLSGQIIADAATSTAYDQSVQDIKSWCSDPKKSFPDNQERSNVAQLIYHLLNSLKSINDDLTNKINQERLYFESLSNQNQSSAMQNATKKIKTLISSTLSDSKTLLETPIKTLTQKLGALSDCYTAILNSLPDENKTITLAGSKDQGTTLPKASQVLGTKK